MLCFWLVFAVFEIVLARSYILYSSIVLSAAQYHSFVMILCFIVVVVVVVFDHNHLWSGH